jgi:methanogenic corrinoid protein MtbC1
MRDQIINAVTELNENRVLNTVNEALDRGYSAEYILDAVELGTYEVGKRYEKSELFIADLMMAGIIFKEVLKLKGIRSASVPNHKVPFIGTIVIGSVRTDKHNIGKDIFIGVAKSSKFNIIDLGTDVPEEKFVDAVRKYKPDILGMSALLTSAMKYMKNTVEMLTAEGLRDNVKIIVAGNPLSENACEYVGADAFTKKSSEGLKICLDWMAEKHGR